MEEWQSNDSGYLNCIGVGDTYVRKQLERIINENKIKAKEIFWIPNNNVDYSVEVFVNEMELIEKEEARVYGNDWES